MSGLSGLNYHRLRAEAELARAAQASDARIAALHRELAELHLSAEGQSHGEAGLSLVTMDSYPTHGR